MSTRLLLALPLVAGLCTASDALQAESSSARLAVGVTVTRSCAVRATSLDRGAAQVDLTCAPGAASGLRRSGEERSGPSGTIRLQTRTVPHAASGDLELATVNF